MNDDHPQMHPDEVDSPDMALAFALQTHLCYSYIQPGDLPFRVLKERLTAIGYRVVREPARVKEGEPA